MIPTETGKTWNFFRMEKSGNFTPKYWKNEEFNKLKILGKLESLLAICPQIVLASQHSQRNRFSIKSRVFKIKALQKDYLSTPATVLRAEFGIFLPVTFKCHR